MSPSPAAPAHAAALPAHENACILRRGPGFFFFGGEGEGGIIDQSPHLASPPRVKLILQVSTGGCASRRRRRRFRVCGVSTWARERWGTCSLSLTRGPNSARRGEIGQCREREWAVAYRTRLEQNLQHAKQNDSFEND